MTLLKFSRQFEKDADFLGVQYLYKTGYDPASMVQFSERLKALSKKRKNAIAKAFSSHPLTAARIKAVQRTINELLPEQGEYAVTSSEFQDIKARLEKLNARQKQKEADPNRPTLKRSGRSEPVLPGETEEGSETDEQPKLKRRSQA